MSFPPRPPMVPYGIAPGVVTMPMATHVMVGAYGPGGRGPLLPAPPTKAVIQRAPIKNNTNGAKEQEGPPVTVFIGNITARAPDTMIRALLDACGTVLSWKRVSTFGFCEFSCPEAALRCVRLLSDRQLADKKLLARVDGKMQALVDTYKTEQRSRLTGDEKAPGTESDVGNEEYLDARQRAADDTAEKRLQQIMQDYQEEINNYEIIQKEEAISKTARVLEEADISEEKRDVIHREIGKFRESMKEEAVVVVRPKREKEGEKEKDKEKDKDRAPSRERDRERERERDRDRERERDRGERERERDRDRGERERERDRDRDKERRKRSISRGKDRRDEREKDREREREEREREREREREKEREKERERERENREREREREQRERERERERERDRERERERDRERSREHERERERDHERSRGRSRSEVDSRRDREIEEEAREKKRLETKAREKEAAYQERLRKWESRERRKAKEYEKEKERERCREEEREKEAKRLKEFLEDYDDERDDHKYYKGKELQRRLGSRVREAESDAREREREQEELNSLKREIFGDKPDDDPSANAAFEKAKREQEELYKPRLLVDVSLEAEQQREREEQRARQREEARKEAREKAARERERYLRAQATRQLPTEAEPIDSDDSGGGEHAAQVGASPSPASPTSPASPGSPAASPASAARSLTPPRPRKHHHHHHHRRRSELVESPQLSDGATTPPPRSGPPEHSHTVRNPITTSAGSSPLTISFKNTKPGTSPTQNSDTPDRGGVRRVHAAFAGDDDSASPAEEPKHGKHKSKDKKEKDKDKSKKSGESGSEKESKSAEEKRKHIKSLIDKIPTQKEQLFQYKLDTSQIDNTLMEKKIRPWINKKIIEYIGEPEPTLVDFICSKVVAGSAPQGILDDVQMVLDEEAEVFVVKMWRLVIYELEAKRAGLHK